MNKPVVIGTIVAVVGIFVLGGFLLLQNTQQKYERQFESPQVSPTEGQKEQQENQEKSPAFGAVKEKRQVGNVEFRVVENAESTYATTDDYFEVLMNEQSVYISRPTGVTDISEYQLLGETYVVITEYTGGANCCWQPYLFVVDENGNLRNTAFTFQAAKGDLPKVMEKNGKVYMGVSDNALWYLHTGNPQGGIEDKSFTRYFLVGEDTITPAHDVFAPEYREQAGRVESILQQDQEDIQKLKSFGQNSFAFEDWWSPLVKLTVLYVLAGDEQTASAKLNEYYAKFTALPEFSDRAIDLDEVKQTIKEAVGRDFEVQAIKLSYVDTSTDR